MDTKGCLWVIWNLGQVNESDINILILNLHFCLQCCFAFSSEIIFEFPLVSFLLAY